MLEKVNLDKDLSHKEYKRLLPRMQRRLYELEKACWDNQISTIIVFEGWDAAGKGSAIATLSARLDPRGFKLYPIHEPRTFERNHPWLWRFWLRTPNRGEMAIFDRSWYMRVLDDRVAGAISEREWRDAYRDIVEFERALADDGTAIVKFWLHISRKEQKQRFKQLEKDPLTAWHVNPADWERHKKYGQYYVATEEMLERTESEWGPWTIVEATCRWYARKKIFDTLIRTMEQRLGDQAPPSRVDARDEADDAALRAAMAAAESAAGPSPKKKAKTRKEGLMLSAIDLSLSLDRETYEAQLTRRQIQLRELSYQIYLQKRPTMLVFEGWDAAGKGGAIKRVTELMDPRGYVVYPISAPAGEDQTHHYLYRFWRRLPEAGQIAIFDRSWYGRVLVERVEGFCTEAEWKRAYREINSFERQLRDHGTVLVKFWMHISRDEQLRRFEERQQTGYKAWKLTDEDWRNRQKWGVYEAAVGDMLLKTSTLTAPWTIVEGNDKWWARVKVLSTLVDVFSRELNYTPQDPLTAKGGKKLRRRMARL